MVVQKASGYDWEDVPGIATDVALSPDFKVVQFTLAKAADETAQASGAYRVLSKALTSDNREIVGAQHLTIKE